MKKNDIFLLAGILFLALAIATVYFIVYPKHGNTVQVTVDGVVVKTFPLSQNTSYTIQAGPGKENVLEIKDGHARITTADCPDKLCVHQRKISRQGETLVCLPHKVVVSIISSKKATLDGVAG